MQGNNFKENEVQQDSPTFKKLPNPISMSFKKRPFSCLYKNFEPLHHEELHLGKKQKPLTVSTKYNVINHFNFPYPEKVVSDFKPFPKNPKKVIKSTEELIIEESKKHKFKATPFNKGIFNCIQRKFTTKDELLKKNRQKSCQGVKKLCLGKLPSFAVMEVKKSDRMLTVALSPHLHTKDRSLQRLQKGPKIQKVSSFKSFG